MTVKQLAEVYKTQVLYNGQGNLHEGFLDNWSMDFIESRFNALKPKFKDALDHILENIDETQADVQGVRESTLNENYMFGFVLGQIFSKHGAIAGFVFIIMYALLHVSVVALYNGIMYLIENQAAIAAYVGTKKAVLLAAAQANPAMALVIILGLLVVAGMSIKFLIERNILSSKKKTAENLSSYIYSMIDERIEGRGYYLTRKFHDVIKETFISSPSLGWISKNPDEFADNLLENIINTPDVLIGRNREPITDRKLDNFKRDVKPIIVEAIKELLTTAKNRYITADNAWYYKKN